MTKVERALLKRVQVALDDWLNIYAATECSPLRVREAQVRVMDNGGTIAYIADLQSEIRKALK